MDFNQVAREWDDEGRIARAQIIADEMKRVVGVGGRRIRAAMEFGCGTGLISLLLQNDIESILLVDNASEMIKIVDEKIEQYGYPHMQAKCCDFLKEEGEDALDLVYTSMALHHVVPVQSLCTQFYQVLRVGGAICIVDLNPDDGSFHGNEPDFSGYHGFEQAELAQMLREIGYSDVKSHTFYEDTRERDGKAIPYSLFIMVAYKK